MGEFLSYLGVYLALCAAGTVGYFARGLADRWKGDGK